MGYKEKGRGCVESYKRSLRIQEYNLNLKLCLYCKSPLSYDKRKNKFCSQSCAASYNNSGILRNNNGKNGYGEFLLHAIHPCLSCGRPTKNKKYCSVVCPHQCKKEKIFEEIKKSGILHSHENGDISDYSKEYLLILRGHQCQDCLNTLWKNCPITLEFHHVDGNPENNNISNIQILCPNCHSYTDTSKGKNRKGNGKWSRRNIKRRSRYNMGLSS